MGTNVMHGSRRTDEIGYFLKFRDIKILGLISVLALGNVVFGQAAETEDPAIIKGYGTTKWGQSLEAVKKLLRGGEEVKTKEDTTHYRVKRKGQIVDEEYEFIDDQLWMVKVRLALVSGPEVGPDKEGVELIREILNKKYSQNKDVRKKLRTEDIYIIVDLYSGKVVVTYTNGKIRHRAKMAIKKRKQEEKTISLEKRRESKRFKEIEKTGIGDAL